MWYFALDCMELLYIFLLHGGYENVYFFSYILGGWGAGLLVRKWQSVCITAVYQDYWRLMELLYIYWFLSFTTVNYPSSDCTVCIFVSKLLMEYCTTYRVNEKINQKYTVSFLLSIHLVIWLSCKIHIREANPTKVEKCLWSAKWARIPVYENYVSNEK